MNDNNDLVNEKFHLGLLAFPKLLIKGLNNLGVPVEELINRSLIKNFNLESQHQYLPLHVIYDFFEVVYEYNSDPSFWDKATRHFQFYSLGLPGQYLCSLSNVVDFIHKLSKYDRFFSTNQNIHLSVEAHNTIISLRNSDSPRIGRSIIKELLLLSILGIIKSSLGKNHKSVEVFYPKKEQKIMQTFSTCKDGSHDQKHINIVVHNKTLSNNIKCDKSTNIHAAQLQYPPHELSMKLEYLFENNMCSGLPTLDLMAKFFNLSQSALKRRLALTQNTYQDIISRWRLNKAMNLLLQTQYKMSSISDELYYSDNANFTRAFKRWVGVTPRKFRNTNFRNMS